MLDVLGAGGDTLTVTGPDDVVTPKRSSVTPAIALVIVFVAEAIAVPPSML